MSSQAHTPEDVKTLHAAYVRASEHLTSAYRFACGASVPTAPEYLHADFRRLLVRELGQVLRTLPLKDGDKEFLRGVLEGNAK